MNNPKVLTMQLSLIFTKFSISAPNLHTASGCKKYGNYLSCLYKKNELWTWTWHRSYKYLERDHRYNVECETLRLLEKTYKKIHMIFYFDDEALDKIQVI